MKNWKSIVKNVAPTIATALGGPIAGMATKALSSGLLGKDNGTDSEIYEALLSPDGLAKLKEVESNFEIEMKKLDINLARIAKEDRSSARELAKSTGLIPQVTLSAIFIGGFFIVLWSLFDFDTELTNSQENLYYFLLGVLGSGVTMILKFWFGGSPHDAQQLDNVYNAIPRDQLKK